MKANLLLALAIGCCFQKLAGASPQDCLALPAGVIIDFAGVPTDYAVVRSGNGIEFHILLELVAGDRLRVLSQEGYIDISQGDGSIKRLTTSDGEVCISTGRPTTWAGNAWRIIRDLVGKSRANRVGYVTREEPPSLGPRDLSDGTARVAAGTRPFAIGWHGGVAPFSITVMGPMGELVTERAIDSQVLRLRKPLDLVPGAYRVTLVDATGRDAQGAFTVVADDETVRIDSASAAMLAAGKKLASGIDRHYDAFLVLAPYRSNHENIKVIADALIEQPQ